jgi:replicative DNA helicase
MRTRRQAAEADKAQATPDQTPSKPREIHHNLSNEQVVIGAALCSTEQRSKMLRLITSDFFFSREHREIWKIIHELERRKLDYDAATVQQLFGEQSISLMEAILDARPEVPTNVEHHVESLIWDKARLTTASGPLAKLVEKIASPATQPEELRAIAKQVETSLGDYGSRRFLRAPEELIRQQVDEIKARVGGQRSYPFGINGLDYFDTETCENRRMVPGAAPGKVTVLTGLSGAGKSAVAASMILSLARLGRRIAVGAWEMGAGMSLELLACLDTNITREQASQGRLQPEDIVRLEESMHKLSMVVRFIELPFRRTTNERSSNARNLDIVHGYVADCGADVFVADLWERCLVNTDVEEEKQALFRQQAMAEEMGIHAILLAQQRLKDVEQRPDKRPTREGIKGSGAWTEIADTILGVHRPALWSRVEDTTLEIIVLKQRYGKWPLAIEFDWNPNSGAITGGRDVMLDYQSQADQAVARDLPKAVVSHPNKWRKGGPR